MDPTDVMDAGCERHSLAIDRATREARSIWYREHGYIVFHRLPVLFDFLDTQR